MAPLKNPMFKKICVISLYFVRWPTFNFRTLYYCITTEYFVMPKIKKSVMPKSKAVKADSRGKIKWKWQKELEPGFCSCYCKLGTVRILPFHPFVVLHLPNQNSKERTCAPARFPVLKGPIRRQTVRAKQAGHFPLFNWPTGPHSSKELYSPVISSASAWSVSANFPFKEQQKMN